MNKIARTALARVERVKFRLECDMESAYTTASGYLIPGMQRRVENVVRSTRRLDAERRWAFTDCVAVGIARAHAASRSSR